MGLVCQLPMSCGPLGIANSHFYSKLSFPLENQSCGVWRCFLDASFAQGSNFKCSEHSLIRSSRESPETIDPANVSPAGNTMGQEYGWWQPRTQTQFLCILGKIYFFFTSLENKRRHALRRYWAACNFLPSTHCAGSLQLEHRAWQA